MDERRRRGGRARQHTLLILILAVLVATAVPAPVGAGEPEPSGGHSEYIAPVDGEVVDRFRLTDGPYGPGNRGIDYATTPGAPVWASAPGTVTFAGLVAGSLHVTVAHDDGLRTTYAFLKTVETLVGATVAQGAVVGTAGHRLHFSVRRGEEYVDPETVLVRVATVHLVPEDEAPNAPPDGSGTGAGFPVSAADVAWATETPAGRTEPPWPAARTVAVDPAAPLLAAALLPSRPEQTCTPASVAPTTTPGRRIAVLVGGLGSSSDSAAIDDVDTVALGYGAGDVIRFSYRGGRATTAAPVRDDLAEIAATAYSAADTTGDIRDAGARLAGLLVAVAEALAGTDSADGTVIDVIAHSQGGIVARVALAQLVRDGTDATLARVGVVVTLGSPHMGADLAAAVRLVDRTRLGDQALELIGVVAGLSALSADSPAVAQLAPGSRLLADLAVVPQPPARIVSIGARGDVVVPAHRTRLPGATNVIVSVPGVTTDHDALPAAPATFREVALAIAGLPPTCESAGDRVTDAVTGRFIGFVELAAGVLAALAASAALPGT